MIILTLVSAEVLVYNRVPRTASTTTIRLLEKLSIQNEFTLVAATHHAWDAGLWKYWPHASQNETTARVAADLRAVQFEGDVLLHGHITIDVALQLGRVFSIVRNPVRRTVSEFGYTRAGCPASGQGGCPALQFNMSVEECLRNDCKYYLARLCRTQAEIICGRDSVPCTALDFQTRKDWLQHTYTWLGNSDALSATFATLELRLPRFFKGASALFDADVVHNSADLPSNDVLLHDAFLEGACAFDTQLYDTVTSAFPISDSAAC